MGNSEKSFFKKNRMFNPFYVQYLNIEPSMEHNIKYSSSI